MIDRYDSVDDQVQNKIPDMIRERFNIRTIKLIKEYHVESDADVICNTIDEIRSIYPNLKVMTHNIIIPGLDTSRTRMLLFKILLKTHLLIII